MLSLAVKALGCVRAENVPVSNSGCDKRQALEPRCIDKRPWAPNVLVQLVIWRRQSLYSNLPHWTGCAHTKLKLPHLIFTSLNQI
jgi:hypothetical protein